MKKRIIYSLSIVVTIFVLVAIIYFFVGNKESDFSIESVKPLTTAEYIKQFSVSKYENDGSDYFNKKYDVESRLHKPRSQIDITYDYDFNQLDRVERKLKNVDRRIALKYIFDQVTKGADSNLEKHLKVLRFLQKVHYDNVIQPMYRDKQMVMDPLVLLELHEMRCGQVARLAVDLFEAAGYKGRLVQASGYVLAEIYYDNDWHYLDAERSGGGFSVIIDGKIPSVAEMAKTPRIVDQINPSVDIVLFNDKGSPAPFIANSYFLFAQQAYKGLSDMPSYYYKTATQAQEKDSKYYGWEFYKSEYNRWKLSDIGKNYLPSRTVVKSIKIKNNKLDIVLDKTAISPNNFAKEYRVFVSTKSRGWNYHKCDNISEVCKYFSPYNYIPSMNDKLYDTPPSDLGEYEIKKDEINLDLSVIKRTIDGYVYITIEPVSRYVEKYGAKQYINSYEFRIPLNRDI